MDHIRISGNGPISDPYPNKVVSNVENDCPKVPNQAKDKRDGVKNPQYYNFNQF